MSHLERVREQFANTLAWLLDRGQGHSGLGSISCTARVSFPRGVHSSFEVRLGCYLVGNWTPTLRNRGLALKLISDTM